MPRCPLLEFNLGIQKEQQGGFLLTLKVQYQYQRKTGGHDNSWGFSHNYTNLQRLKSMALTLFGIDFTLDPRRVRVMSE